MAGALLLSVLHADEHAAPKLRLPPDHLSGEEAQAVKLYKKVLPAVVTIFTTEEAPTAQGWDSQEVQGSGVLISSEGHVLTAAHVVERAEQIRVKPQDGQSRGADLIYSESSADVALVRLHEPGPGLPYATLGDSDRLAVGQMAYVIGSPFGLENSLSVGHISGFREFNRLYDGTILAEFIQTDAAINSGNSGGPVFNFKGEVIGLASRILTQSGGSEGLGFVIAINTAKQLLALEKRAWMGIDGTLLDREALASLMNLDLDGGLLIQRVARGSPAEKADLRGGSIRADLFGEELLLGGDLIVELGDQEACHSACLVRAGQRLAGVDKIPVTFLRGGKRMQVVVDVSATRRDLLHAMGRE